MQVLGLISLCQNNHSLSDPVNYIKIHLRIILIYNCDVYYYSGSKITEEELEGNCISNAYLYCNIVILDYNHHVKICFHFIGTVVLFYNFS